jgi:hypothetical protein
MQNNRTSHTSLCALLTAVGFALIGCGGSDASDKEGSAPEGSLSASTVQSFEGIYGLESYTENPASCDAEGPSTLSSKTEQRFVLVGSSLLGTRFLQLASCADDATCANRVAAIRAPSGFISEYSLILSEEVGPDALSGFLASSGFSMGDTCTEREYVEHELTRSGDAVHVESRTIPLADAPMEDGACWAKPTEERAEAEGRPCAALSTFGGTKLGPLP